MTTDNSKSIDFRSVEEMMHQAVRDEVFPGAVIRVQRGREALYHRAFGMANSISKTPVTVDTFFDLASLTKPLATTLAVLVLVQEGRLELDQPVGAVLSDLKDTDKGGIEVRHLLLHTSGLPAHRPYYRQLLANPLANRRGCLNRLLVTEPLTYPTGEKSVYSDIGFMMLRWMVETVSGLRLDRFAEEVVYRPLGISQLFYVPEGSPRRQGVFAATQRCPLRKSLLEGVVGDENAYAAGGVDGQAGLFSTAQAVGDLLGELLAVYRGEPHRGLFHGGVVKRFFQRDEASGRALGFDMPTPGGSSSGGFFSKETVGHLGFTGTSFWSDLRTGISVVLLTNRVHPSVENDRIRVFRPEVHDAVMKSILPQGYCM
jgi:CubicO group peptidase (beta-lactamase class C family)